MKANNGKKSYLFDLIVIIPTEMNGRLPRPEQKEGKHFACVYAEEEAGGGCI